MSCNETILVSSCLVGLCTRYDAQANTSTGCLERIGAATWIPVCPEQLGGLPTPRPPADISGGTGHDVLRGTANVLCRDGSEVTAAFIKGAHQVLEIARKQKISRVLLKARSPSCGVTRLGVTAALLLEQGFKLEEFD
ncbi:MAG: DUF523 domain-containing protein [Desulfocapsaceae bacterium]|jgi:uncharacterized protein YbbK (DUF523 family)|nr:DUF523 domain-containing protein [Desulfocapsaceae bacterium]